MIKKVSKEVKEVLIITGFWVVMMFALAGAILYGILSIPLGM